MKHLLNNLSSEEKNRILKQYEGGMSVDTSKFKTLSESKLGNAKPLINEISRLTINEAMGPGDKLIDEIIPGGAKTMDNLGKLGKVLNDLFSYSARLLELAPSKSFDDFLAVVSKQNNNQEVTADMVKRFIASDAKLTDELMSAAALISEDAVIKLMQTIKIDDVLSKAGLKNTEFEYFVYDVIGFDINSGTVSQIEAGLKSIEDIIKSTNLRYTYEGMEILKHTSGKRQQIEYFKNLKTNYITVVKKTPEIKIVKKTPEIKIVKKTPEIKIVKKNT
jgi:Zn/Cd-binding protein ZinT